jgi:hypothetical protein
VCAKIYGANHLLGGNMESSLKKYFCNLRILKFYDTYVGNLYIYSHAKGGGGKKGVRASPTAH